jgi:uncharacterized protein
MQDQYDFEWLSDLLNEMGLSAHASHLHGSLVGFLCAGGSLQTAPTLEDQMQQQDSESYTDSDQPHLAPSHWTLQLLDDPSLDLPAEVLHELDGFARATGRLLMLEDMRLNLLLPDDVHAMPERSDALTQWCSGFLGGLGLGGFKAVKQLSKDAREALRDLERIARTEIELDDDEEGNESALVELSEFAKVACLLISTELQTLKLGPRKQANVAAPRSMQ